MVAKVNKKYKSRSRSKRKNRSRKQLKSLLILSNNTCNNTHVTKYFKIPYFSITQKDILEFKRSQGHGKDCVINALEILKILNDNSAGILRILIKPFDGISGPIIQNIFSFLYPSYLWNFKEYNTVKEFEFRIVNNFPSNSIIFCGMTFKDDTSHVFLIFKDLSEYFIVDGQLGICNLITDTDCYDFLKNGKKWYMLEYM